MTRRGAQSGSLAHSISNDFKPPGERNWLVVGTALKSPVERAAKAITFHHKEFQP